MLAALPSVLPSRYPDAKFALWDPGYGRPDLATWQANARAGGIDPDKYSDCGAFVAFVAGKGGIHTGGAVPGIRDLAQKRGAWRTPANGRRPRPGDILVLSSDAAGRNIVHVGIATDTTTNVWRTADGGQGVRPYFGSAYVYRAYDPKTQMLRSNTSTRYLVGWLDVAAYTGEAQTVSDGALIALGVGTALMFAWSHGARWGLARGRGSAGSL
jgi:hypothetical protein